MAGRRAGGTIENGDAGHGGPCYRLVAIGSDGTLLSSEPLTATGDDEAIGVALSRLAEHAAELWDGPRLVCRLAPSLFQ